MVGGKAIRHLLPPALALLLSVSILLLNEEGVASLGHPVVVTLVLVLSAGCWYLFRPRLAVRKTAPTEAHRIWRAIAPLAAFFAGPAAVALLWAIAVYGFESEHYVTSRERIEELMAALPIGIVVGFVASMIVAAWMASSD